MNSMNYIGLDIHKKSISFCVRQADGTIIQETPLFETTPPSPHSEAADSKTTLFNTPGGSSRRNISFPSATPKTMQAVNSNADFLTRHATQICPSRFLPRRRHGSLLGLNQHRNRTTRHTAVRFNAVATIPPREWPDAIDQSATGIQTDYPAELIAYMRAKKLHK